MTFLQKPSVPRKWLYAIAGVLWSAAGFILIERAYGWLEDLASEQLLFVLSLGVTLALIFYFAGFIKIARKNINRINSLPDSVCIFAFTAWKGYLIIVVMVTASILLRHSSFPKHYLAVFYVAMGGSLLLGSSLFYTKLFKNIYRRK
jgi:hypothetical protein